MSIEEKDFTWVTTKWDQMKDQFTSYLNDPRKMSDEQLMSLKNNFQNMYSYIKNKVHEKPLLGVIEKMHTNMNKLSKNISQTDKKEWENMINEISKKISGLKRAA